MMYLSPRHATALGLCLLAASPSMAQDVDCADPGAGGQWIGGSDAASDIATRDAYAEQMALVLDGTRYVARFSLSAPQDVRIEAAGRGAGDPTLTVMDATNATVAEDDDSGGGGAARIERTLQPGNYCAVVASFDASPMTAFVRIGRQDMDPLTPGMTGGDDPATTSDTAQGCADGRDLGTLAGDPLTYRASAAEAPFARFTLDAPTRLTVTADNVDADPSLQIRGPDGDLIGENDDFAGLNARVDLTTALAPGTYCIGLGAITDPRLPIDVAVSVYDPVAALALLYDTGDAAPPLDGSVPVTDLGALPARLIQDVRVTGVAQWFSATLDAPGLLLIEAIATGPDGDPWLVLFDDLGRRIAQNDDSGPGTDAQLAARLQPGTYLIGLKQVGDHSGFVRLLTERYIPAP